MQKHDRSIFNYHESSMPMAVMPGEANKEDNCPRCKTCEHFEGRDCLLFDGLNKAMNDVFDLEVVVSKSGVCNAHQPMKKSLKNLKRKAVLASEDESGHKEEKEEEEEASEDQSE